MIGGSFGWNHAYDDVDAKFKQCVTANPADLPVCRDARNKALAVPRAVAAAIIAFGPLLVLWLVLYAFRRLGRWTKRAPVARTPQERAWRGLKRRVLCWSRGRAAMTEKVDTEAKQGFQGKVRDLGGALRDIGGAALRETLNWSAYQWTVLALLTAIFLLIALSYGGIRAELAALKENGGGAGLASAR